MIKVTGYGSTQAEANADANRKLSDARTEEMAMGMAVYAGGGFVGLAIEVAAGYFYLAVQLIGNFVARPLATLLTIISIGSVLGAIIYAGIAMDDSPAPSAFERFGRTVVIIAFGSCVAWGLSKIITPMTEWFEQFEIAFISKSPFIIRMPLMVAILSWPTAIMVWMIGTISKWTISGFLEHLVAMRWYEYLLWFVILVIIQGFVASYRLASSPLSQNFNWYGAPRIEPESKPTVGKMDS